MTDMTGKVAIVTGAAQGLGESVARLLADRGARVALLDINIERAQDVTAHITASKHEAIALQADMTKTDDIENAVSLVVKRWNRLDVLINNASNVASLGDKDGDVVSTSLDTWDTVYACNLRGPAAACKYSIPHMIAGGGGAIVNIASTQGLSGDMIRTAYGSTKAGLIMLSKYVATAFGAQGIRCNSVAPGLMMTKAAHDHAPKEFLEMIMSHILTPGVCQPEDVAELVAFLVSDSARFINGENITADGGQMNHQPFYADLRRGVAAF